MNKDNIKGVILRQKLSILIITVLLIIIGGLFVQKQNYKFALLYQYQAIPDIELMNTLTTARGGLSGEARGFVKFDNVADQPKNLRQYYIIKPLSKFDENSRIKMQYLAPKSLGFSELVEVSDTGNTIFLEDGNENKFFIDKSTKEISIKDSTGDSTKLITSNDEYEDFIKKWLR